MERRGSPAYWAMLRKADEAAAERQAERQAADLAEWEEVRRSLAAERAAAPAPAPATSSTPRAPRKVRLKTDGRPWEPATWRARATMLETWAEEAIWWEARARLPSGVQPGGTPDSRRALLKGLAGACKAAAALVRLVAPAED